MPDLGWDESSPADIDSAGLGDDAIRSLKTTLRIGLDYEHNWPTSGIGAGIHRLGSARAYYAAQSLVSSSGTDGRLMVTSDSSKLFHVGSAGTMFLGSSGAISHGSYINPRTYWAEESGSTVWATGVQQSTTIAFPNSGFSGLPVVTMSILSQLPAASNTINPVLVSLTPTTFVAYHTRNDGVSVGGFTMFWRSLGTRTF